MITTRKLWRALVAPVAVLTIAGVSQALVAGPPAGAQTPTWVAVVEGSDGAAWYLNPEPSPASAAVWTSLGGRVLSTPAVADYSGSPFGGPVPVFAAIGSDHQVWLTSVGSAPTWYPVGGYCVSSPAAAISTQHAGGVDGLAIACEGLDGAMWAETVILAPNGRVNIPIPIQIVHPFTSYGGTLGAGPGIAELSDSGPIYFAETPSHQVFYALEGQPDSWTPTPFYCTGHLAGDFASPIVSSANPIAFGCQGLDGEMWVVTTTSANTLTGLTALPEGGGLIGGPGLAYGASTLMFAEGTNHTAWAEVAGTTPWFDLGGNLLGDGVNAVTLS